MDMLEGIYTRRSVRKFTADPVERQDIIEIISAGMWAPSGLNNQPWRFVIIQKAGTREALAALTKYGKIIKGAPVCIAVFLDKGSMYNETKDHQGIGACLQNMLLAAHALGLGAVWLGEVLNRAEDARDALGVSPDKELMAVVAVGHPASREHSSKRKGLQEMLLKEL